MVIVMGVSLAPLLSLDLATMHRPCLAFAIWESQAAGAHQIPISLGRLWVVNGAAVRAIPRAPGPTATSDLHPSIHQLGTLLLAHDAGGRCGVVGGGGCHS